MVKFLEYKSEHGQIILKSNDRSFLPEHLICEKKVKEFIQDIGYKLLDDEILTKEVKGISLELQEDVPSIYNCLFEDSASFYSTRNKPDNLHLGARRAFTLIPINFDPDFMDFIHERIANQVRVAA